MKKRTRPYLRQTLEALRLLSKHIKVARVELGMTTKELATRAGVSRDLLYRIEKGDPSCSIGSVFEVASILGLELFNAGAESLEHQNKTMAHRLSFLPKRVSSKKIEVDDDF